MVFFQGLELTTFHFTCLAVAGSILAGTSAYVLMGPARRVGLVSRSRRDRFGARRVPLTGGPGLLLGIAAPIAALGLPLEAGQIAALVAFFLVGLVDDLYNLRPLPKLGLQLGAAFLSVALLPLSPAYAGLGLALFLLLVNASNYLDNMDGLLAGVALTQAVALMNFSAFAGAGGVLLVWALPAIVFLTIPPARVYLGDSGSHLIGALLALDAIELLVDVDGLHPRFFLPLGVLFAVPLVDTATVTVSRLRRKRPVFRGGLDHLSHRLVRAGFPVPRAVLVLVLASGVCGVASLLLVHSS